MWGPIIGMMDGGDRAKMDKQRQRIHDITYSCDDRAELAERIVTLEDENKKLQERVEWLDGECRKSMGASHKFFEMVGEYQKENEKLRDLVRDMWRFTGTACKKYPRLFDPAAQGGQMVQLNMIDAFEQRMRELGIEAK